MTRSDFLLSRLRQIGQSPRALAYLCVAVLALGATQTWFRPGTFVAGGDIAPFIRDSVASEATSLWGHDFTSAGSPSRQIARAPELAA
ncbi:MAG: hypothetical protein ACREA0_03385, partial [bacterium]